jgi:threonylcarbamoyladenosine tRNA methylthiotransferase MtaB
MVRDAIQDLAVTTDILVGFPGEGEKEFNESYRFCEKIGFANIHVFPYSPRLGTKAAGMSSKVEEGIKKERSQRMLALAHQSASAFKKRFLGRTMSVLWESQSELGVWSGMTDNYLRVSAISVEDLANCLLHTKLVAEHPHGLFGEIADGGKE